MQIRPHTKVKMANAVDSMIYKYLWNLMGIHLLDDRNDRKQCALLCEAVIPHRSPRLFMN